MNVDQLAKRGKMRVERRTAEATNRLHVAREVHHQLRAAQSQRHGLPLEMREKRVEKQIAQRMQEQLRVAPVQTRGDDGLLRGQNAARRHTRGSRRFNQRTLGRTKVASILTRSQHCVGLACHYVHETLQTDRETLLELREQPSEETAALGRLVNRCGDSRKHLIVMVLLQIEHN
jgi:hypothetical protein